jgi:hypothetical protein
MALKIGDPNEEIKESFLKAFDGSAPPEISAKVANCRASIAAAASAYKVDEKIVHRLVTDAESFRWQSAKAIEDMGKAHLDRIMKKKWVRKDDAEMSDNEVMKHFAMERKYSLSGWTLAPYDPNRLIELFPCLNLRKGYHLGSYQYQSNGNGRACVFVLPAKRSLPKRPPEKALDNISFDGLEKHLRSFLAYKVYSLIMSIPFPSYRPLPAWANRDVEYYVEGDGSPLSYFQASLFSRELYELGALWHDLYWATHKIITSPDALPDEEFTWYEPEPEEWCPIIWKDQEQRWNATFYTLDDMNAELVFHNDIFISGYAFGTFSTSIATYPGGYMV